MLRFCHRTANHGTYVFFVYYAAYVFYITKYLRNRKRLLSAELTLTLCLPLLERASAIDECVAQVSDALLKSASVSLVHKQFQQKCCLAYPLSNIPCALERHVDEQVLLCGWTCHYASPDYIKRMYLCDAALSIVPYWICLQKSSIIQLPDALLDLILRLTLPVFDYFSVTAHPMVLCEHAKQMAHSGCSDLKQITNTL